jgi:H+-transporting ATPase
MADQSASGAPALSTNIESGKFDEKAKPPKAPVEEEEEDEDIDALIDDLESNDGHQVRTSFAQPSLSPGHR